jgi:hypothetical protein
LLFAAALTFALYARGRRTPISWDGVMTSFFVMLPMRSITAPLSASAAAEDGCAREEAAPAPPLPALAAAPPFAAAVALVSTSVDGPPLSGGTSIVDKICTKEDAMPEFT